MRILFYGYGNPGRCDDGLGFVFTERLKHWCSQQGISHVAFDTNYQLNIEDADTIRDYDLVIFCDASQEDIPGFCFSRVTPSDARIEFTMHAVSPAFILDLTQQLFNTSPEVWLLHLKGVTWDFGEGLSREAQENLHAAFTFITTHLLPAEDPVQLLENTLHRCSDTDME